MNTQERDQLAKALEAVERARNTAWAVFTDTRRAYQQLEQYCQQQLTDIKEAKHDHQAPPEF